MATMGGTEVGVFLAGEERSLRRRVLTRSALAFGLGPVAAYATYGGLARLGVTDPLVETLSLVALSLLVTTVAVSGLVVLTFLTPRPLVLFLVGGVLAWASTTLALESTASGGWVPAGLFSVCVVVAPLVVVLGVVRPSLLAWIEHERQK